MEQCKLLENMTLQEAIYEVVHHSKKPAKVIAEECGMGLSHLTRAALPKEGGSGYNLPADKINPITASSQNYIILDVLEWGNRRIGIDLLSMKDKSSDDICRLTMDSVKEFGELVAAIRKALNNNKLEPKERKQIWREGYQALQVIYTTMMACKGDE